MLTSQQTSRHSRYDSAPMLDQPRRVVHKNESFDKFRNWKIERENGKLMKRLVGASCQVVKKHQTQGSFRKHLHYKGIRAKFDQEGNRKHILSLGKSELLCPTLNNFNKSGHG